MEFIYIFLGFWVKDKSRGTVRYIKDTMPQLDPCCFPVLHPHGTPGFRWFITKQGRDAQKQLDMQNRLDNARLLEFDDGSFAVPDDIDTNDEVLEQENDGEDFLNRDMDAEDELEEAIRIRQVKFMWFF